VEQELKPPPSISHAKVEEPSVELKVKEAFAEPDGSDGFESIVVFGAAVSIVKERLGPDSVFNALSFARTWTV
jgi:hypothetical protein